MLFDLWAQRTETKTAEEWREFIAVEQLLDVLPADLWKCVQEEEPPKQATVVAVGRMAHELSVLFRLSSLTPGAIKSPFRGKGNAASHCPSHLQCSQAMSAPPQSLSAETSNETSTAAAVPKPAEMEKKPEACFN